MKNTIPEPSKEDLRDLGFGAKVTQETSVRLLNRDGSFNVSRRGLSFFQSLSLYHLLLTMQWWNFHITIFLAYFLVNVIFAVAFLLLGPNALEGAAGITLSERFLDSFFFSVQTFTSVGYGHITPNGFIPNVLVTIDAFFGLLIFALATGLLFARFSRPTAKIIFSDVAVIAPYRGITAFEFRIVNARSNQLLEVELKVIFSRIETVNGQSLRRFHELPLERQKVAFFPLNWTIVHPIEETSPLFGLTEKDLNESEAEFFILLTAIDDTFSQTVHSRSSYRYNEIVWKAKFSNLLQKSDDGMVTVDLHRIHDIEKLETFA